MKVKTEKSAENKKEAAVRKFLDSYLKGAVALTAGAKKARASSLLENFYKKADKTGLSEDDLVNASLKKEAELKKKASKFGLKTKLNYATDADHRSFDKDDAVETVGKTVCAGIAAGMGGVMFSLAQSGMTGTMDLKSMATNAAVGTLLPAAGVTIAKAGKLVAAQLTKSKTDAEKKNAEDYAAIKHAQLALKTMRKIIFAPEESNETDRDLQQTAMTSSQTAIRTAVFNTTFSR